MAKRIRGLSRERLSHTVDLKKICRCKEAEDGEHECPAFDYLQEQAKPQCVSVGVESYNKYLRAIINNL
jgi:hypothetical protein